MTLEVKNLLDCVNNAISIIREENPDLFGDDYDNDLKNKLGMSNNNMEIFNYALDIPEDLVVPISFVAPDSPVVVVGNVFYPD